MQTLTNNYDEILLQRPPLSANFGWTRLSLTNIASQLRCPPLVAHGRSNSDESLRSNDLEKKIKRICDMGGIANFHLKENITPITTTSIIQLWLEALSIISVLEISYHFSLFICWLILTPIHTGLDQNAHHLELYMDWQISSHKYTQRNILHMNHNF